ncbi:MAG: hypothetical protein ABIP17_03450 [Ilumatobacteraceae bacterium]
MDSAAAWKQFYRSERDRLGLASLQALVDAADPLDVKPGTGAVVVPHTRIEVTGGQIARAVATVLDSGADRVLALGVLHGARRADRERVAAARAGDADARRELRGVHDERGLASEEFSLDGFTELLTSAARRIGRSIDIVCRYPFLVGDEPDSLPGFDELERLVSDGAFLIATTDPIHHGHAYGTAADRCLDPDDAATIDLAETMIGEQLDALVDHRFGAFQQLTASHQSDFRDTGPVTASLLGAGFTHEIDDLALVDYSSALEAETPSWVAGALITMSTP